MIIMEFLNAIELLVFNVLFTSDVPPLDDAILEVMETIKNTIISAFDIFFFFVPKQVVFICFGVFLTYYGFTWAYRILMFVLRKVPLLSIR